MFLFSKSKDMGMAYTPLVKDWEDSSNADLQLENKRQPPNRWWNIMMMILLLVFTNLALSTVLVLQKNRENTIGHDFPQILYSPAQDVLKSKIVRSSNGFRDDVPIFQGKPSPELDEAWESLYSFGISRIPRSQARLLPNKTTAIPGDEEHYVVELDVFHELHCLNMIRKALRPDYYKPTMVGADGEDELFGHTHIDHCVDSIRQSLMCSADISPLVWQWKEDFQETKIRADIVHSCRDFESIREWAVEHQLRENFDLHTHIEDDIVIEGF